MRRFFILFFFLQIAWPSHSEIWNLVWREDFGVAEDSIIKNFPDPSMTIPNHTFDECGYINDGSYGIANSTWWAFLRKSSCNLQEAHHFTAGGDHTRNENGAMLIVNVGSEGNGEVIYEQDITFDICPTRRKYRFSIFGACVSFSSYKLLLSNLTLNILNIKDPDNPVVIKSGETGDLPLWSFNNSYNENPTGEFTHIEKEWEEYALGFEAEEGDVIRLQILNKCRSGVGNDFVLDDISLYRLDDEEVIAPIIEANISTVEVPGGGCHPSAIYEVSNDILDSWKKIYNKIYCLWQVSLNDGYTWQDLDMESGIESMTMSRVPEAPGAGKHEIYRLIITGGDTAEEARKEAKYIGAHGGPSNGCVYFSISSTIASLKQTEEELPTATVGIDMDEEKTEEPPFDCDESEQLHTINLFTNGWEKIKHTLIWQYSLDDGKTWFTYPATAESFAFDNSLGENKIVQFRAILAKRQKVAEEVAQYGNPGHPCEKDYQITNAVSIGCIKKCKRPEFVPDGKGSITLQRNKKSYSVTTCSKDVPIVCNVKEESTVPIDSARWYVKSARDKEWTLLSDEIVYEISYESKYDTTQIYFIAWSGECPSDTIYFETKTILMDPFLFTTSEKVCGGGEISFTARNDNPDLPVGGWGVLERSEDGEEFKDVDGGEDGQSAYQSNPFHFTDVLPDMEESEVDSKTYYYRVRMREASSCSWAYSNVITVEEVRPPSFTIEDIPFKICEGTSIELTSHMPLGPDKKFAWKRGEETLSTTELSITDTPTESTTYSFIAESEVCPSQSTSSPVTVVKPDQLTLKSSADKLCEDNALELIVTRQNQTGTLIWEISTDEGKTFTEIAKSSKNTVSTKPQQAAQYRVKTEEEICPAAYSNIVEVYVEKKVNDLKVLDLPQSICKGSELSLKASATVDPSVNTFAWKKDGKILTDQEMSITDTPEQTASYVFSLLGEYCSYPVREFIVEVEEMAEVSFDPIPKVICEGSDILLKASADLDPAIHTFVWEKEGNALTTSELSISDTPTESTKYQFTLTSKECGTLTKEFTVEVEAKEELELTADKEGVCAGESATLKATKGNPQNILWEESKDGQSFVDLNASGGEATITPSETKYYRLKTDITGKACPVVYSNSVAIVVENKVDVEFEAVPSVICEGTSVELTAKGDIDASINSFAWTKNGSPLASEMSTSDTPTESTTYAFSLSGKYCEALTKEFTVEVEAVEELELTADKDGVCAGESATLKATKGNPQNLLWEESKDGLSFVDLNASGEEATITPSETKYYRLKTDITGKACPVVYSNSVAIVVENKVDVEFEAVPSVVCEGTSVELTAKGNIDASINSFAWTKNGSPLASEMSMSDTPTENTTYAFSLSGKYCEALTKEFTVEVEAVEELELTAGKEGVCAGESATLKATKGNPQNILWEESKDGQSFVDLNASGGEATITPSETKYYRLKTDITGKACPVVYSNSVAIVVENKVDVEFEAIPSVVCEGTSVELTAKGDIDASINSFAWTKNGSPLASEMSTSDTPTESTTYAFSLSGKYCEALTKEFTVEVEAVEELELTADKEGVCAGESATLKATKGNPQNILWEESKDGQSFVDLNASGEEATITPSETKYYRLKTDITGKACPVVYSNSVAIVVENKVDVVFEAVPSVVCEGTSVVLTAKGDIDASINSFAWTKDGSPLANTDLSLSDTPTETATYRLSIQGIYCPEIDYSFPVEVEKQPSVGLVISEEGVCEGSEVTLTAQFANTQKMEWQQRKEGETEFSVFNTEVTAEQKITADQSVHYRVIASGTTTCPADTSEEVVLQVEEKITFSLPEEVIICPNEKTTVDAHFSSTPNHVVWSKRTIGESEFSHYEEGAGPIQIAINESAEFVMEYDAQYCPTEKGTFIVTVEEIPTLAAIPDTSICQGESITLKTSSTYPPALVWESKAEGESNYQSIQEGSEEISVTPSKTTQYRISGTSKNGCEAQPITTTITVYSPVEISLTGGAICLGDSLALAISGKGSYTEIKWFSSEDDYENPLGNEYSYTARPELSTNYRVVAYNGKCKGEAEAEIEVHPIPTILSCEETSTKSYQIEVEENPYPLYFDYGDGKGKTTSQTLDNVIFGKTYNIIVSDEIGCQSSYLLEVPTYDLFFPKYFIGEEENWIVTNLDHFELASYKIFDRHGKLLYEGSSTEGGWDGYYQGHAQPSTDYWYIVDVPEKDRQYYGHFTLLRK